MSLLDLLRQNLLSPLVLAFALGIGAKLAKSDLALPKDVASGLSIYLMLAIGLRGGVELSHAPLSAIASPAAATLALGLAVPLAAFAVLTRLCRLGPLDAAAMAAHYGSVSAVTFVAAQQFAVASGTPPEGFMPTLLALLESPGICVALALGLARPAVVVGGGGAATIAAFGAGPELGRTLREVMTSPTMVLLVGGLLVGVVVGESGYAPVKPFFEGGSKGALTLFLLEKGLVTGARLGAVHAAGPRLVAFGLLFPLVTGAAGVLLGDLAGLSIGGRAVLGAMAASASYIAAPAAVRVTLPEADPALPLTAALAITFPFNLALGISAYHALAAALG